MLPFYDNFYRRFGVRKVAHLLQPPLPALELLELPKRSVLHYVTTSPLEGGPAADDFLFRNITKVIQMDHAEELGDTKGGPRRLSVDVNALIRRYHIKNRRFFRMRSLESATRDDNTLLVVNYGFLSHLYRYMRSFYTEYYKWWNIETAVWKHAAAIAQSSDRHQFICLKLPTKLPSLSELRMATGNMSQRVLKVMTTPEHWMLVELWKWFGEERADSLLNHVPAEQLNRINLVFQESGRWFVLNLGLINGWRITPKEELASVKTPITKGFEASVMQRRFLRLMMTLMQVRTDAAPEVKASDNGPAVATTKTVPVTNQTPTVPHTDPNTGVAKTVTTKHVVVDADDHSPDDRAEDIQIDTHVEQQIDADLAELEKLSKLPPDDDAETPVVEESTIQEAITLESGVMKICDRLADAGLLSAAEYRRYQTLAQTYRSIKAPDGKRSLDNYIQIAPTELAIPESPKIPDIPTVVDKTMLKSSLLEFDQKYIKEVLPRDVAAMVLNVQHAGIAVTDYQVERVDDVMGTYEDHTVRVTPVEGAASTFRFKLPVIEDDGTYVANGVKYRMRKQRGDLPIRKIGPDRVALTSYYGKVFASRSDKRVNNYGEWLRNAIMAKGLDDEDTTVTHLQPANVFDNTFDCPRLYSTLAMGFRGFTLKPTAGDRTNGYLTFVLSFDHTKRIKLYGEEAIKTYEEDGNILVGISDKGHYLVLDTGGTFYLATEGKIRPYGTIESLLELTEDKAPVEFAELKVLGRTIPIGLILGYELGLEKLMKLLKVTPRRVPAGSRLNLGHHEYALAFADETLVLSKDDRLAAMILAGFGDYHKSIRQYPAHEFDRRGVYLNVLESQGASVRYVREIDLLYQLFIDPITRDLLVEMHEPTNFHGLLMRCCQLLLSDQHPDELDPAYMRIKGYERMAGAVYGEMVRSIRSHNGRPGKSRQPIDLNPYAVWKAISEDPSKAQVSDINPIENLKQVEAVTYNGTGGRGSRSMTKHTRAYHKNDMGTISESTVDSSDVAINTFTSADPQFTSLRGISRRFKKGESGPTALVSTSALISPGSDRDDPKRVNFIAIQQSHAVACDGYRQMAVRTGYEQVIAHRTGDMFATSAKKPGKVVSVSDTGMVVEYDDGEVKGFELGRRYGSAAGLTIPHTLVTDMKAGQKFKEGEMICYNQGFFERDMLNPSNVVWKAGILVKTALMESTATLEDSSAISKKVAQLLTTKVTKPKQIVVNFDQSVKKLVKVGERVESEDILCVIEDAVTANSDLFDEESLDTLRVLSAQTPQAKAKGEIERIEVYYHGDKEDMSESLRALANASDREMGKRYRSAGRKPFTGSVNENFRVDGEPLALDTLCIKIYITSDVPAGVGDKGVFCNQMKTVFGQVMSDNVKTESGQHIGAIFGQKSIADRIVLSPEIIGTTTTLLDVIAKKAITAYRK